MAIETIANETISNNFPEYGERERYLPKQNIILIKTARLTMNLITNILIVLTVFVCLLYAWSSPKLSVFHLHIILCVLGYQFFMCQATLVISKYNSWSMYLDRRYRRHLHWFLQLIGILLVIFGSCIMIHEKQVNFDTAHGILGLCALITSLMCSFNGLLAMSAHKLSSFINTFYIRHFHYFTGIGTLILSATCLCLGLDKPAFRAWAGNEDTLILIIFTYLFTVFASLDFWIATGNRLRNFI